MSYNTYNIADEIKVMNLCYEIVEIDKEIDRLRLQIGKLTDQKWELNAAIDKIREQARAREEAAGLTSGTPPLADAPQDMP